VLEHYPFPADPCALICGPRTMGQTPAKHSANIQTFTLVKTSGFERNILSIVLGRTQVLLSSDRRVTQETLSSLEY
jgi:hypothetical protein